jgi:hypothetical protein
VAAEAKLWAITQVSAAPGGIKKGRQAILVPLASMSTPVEKSVSRIPSLSSDAAW